MWLVTCVVSSHKETLSVCELNNQLNSMTINNCSLQQLLNPNYSIAKELFGKEEFLCQN